MPASILPITEPPQEAIIELKNLQKPSFPKKGDKTLHQRDEEQPSPPKVASASDEEDRNNNNDKDKKIDAPIPLPKPTRRIRRTITTITNSSAPAPQPTKYDRAMEGATLGALAGGLLGVVAGTITGVFISNDNKIGKGNNETIPEAPYDYGTSNSPFSPKQNFTDSLFNNTSYSTPQEVKDGMAIGAVVGVYAGVAIGAAVAVAFPSLEFGHIAARIRENCNSNQNHDTQR